MLGVMAGPHPLDHTTCEAGPADYLGRLQEGVRGKRIAYSANLDHARGSIPMWQRSCRRRAQRFSELGATVEEVENTLAARGPS